MWSFGAVLLELMIGIPNWMIYKCRVVMGDRSKINSGLFATKNQNFKKLLEKQRDVCENLIKYTKDFLAYFECGDDRMLFQDLLQRIFRFNPKDRISPAQLLQHPFLAARQE